MVSLSDTSLNAILNFFPQDVWKDIENTYRFTAQVHDGVYRSNGEPFSQHLIKTGQIIALWTHDVTLTKSALLHDALDEEKVKKVVRIDAIRETAGEESATIVEVVHRLGHLQEKNLYWGIQMGVSQYLPASINLQALLIKLASGMDLANGLERIPDEEKRRKRGQVLLSKYAALAAQLGMWEYKRWIEDTCLRFISPIEYRTIEEWSQSLFEKHSVKLKDLSERVVKKCSEHGLETDATVYRRHIYSLYQTLPVNWNVKFADIVKSTLSIDQIVRTVVLVHSKMECYRALGILHEIGDPVNEILLDLIATPKPNGYASLHTAIQFREKQPSSIFKFNIRTYAMDQIARAGILYSPSLGMWRLDRDRILAGLPVEDGSYACISKLLDALEQPEHLSRANRIRTFSPEGKRVALPSGSTPLDFAYAVHTELGNKFERATVNYQEVAVSHPLQDGDVVEIHTNPRATPQPEWLNYAVSGRAREKIRHWLNTAPRAVGNSRLQQALASINLNLRSPGVYAKIEEYAGKQTGMDALFEEIGSGRIDADMLVKDIFLKNSQRPHTRIIFDDRAVEKAHRKRIRIKVAECCQPEYPDEITGCIRSNLVVVHRVMCPNALRAARHISVRWEQETQLPVPVEISMKGLDRPGMVRDVAHVIAEHFFNMGEFHATVANGRAEIKFKLELPTPAVPEGLWKDLRSIQDIEELVIPENSLQFLSQHSIIPNETKWNEQDGFANPFSPGRPIYEKSMFFGRRSEIRDIIQYLTPASQPTSILVCAQRRMGKTSLGLHIKDVATIQREYIPVFLDISASKKDHDIALLRKISQHIHSLLGELDLDFKPINSSSNTADAYLLFEENLRLLFKQTHKRLLLILDEFEAALEAYRNGVLSDEFFIRLRAWSQTAPVAFIVIGSQRLGAETARLFPEFANVFLSHPLRGLKPFDARMLILQPARYRLSFEDDAVEALLRLTQCHPYYIHLMCARLFNLACDMYQNHITLEMVEKVRAELAEERASGNYAHLWNNQSPCQEIVLTAIAHRQGGDNWIKARQLRDLGADREIIEKTLHELCGLETLDKHPGEGEFEYHIHLPLFTGWILNNWSPSHTFAGKR